MSSSIVNDGYGEGVYSWTKPQFSDDDAINHHRQAPVHKDEIEAIYNKAYEDGYRAGERDSIEQFNGQAGEKLERIDNLIESIFGSITNQQDAVVNELAKISFLVAKAVIRRELSQDDGQIVAVLTEALKLFPYSARDIVVNVSPGDAELIRGLYANLSRQSAFTIREDPTIERGGCVLQTDTAFIDATIETQINDICYQLLGGTRDSDRDAD